MFRDNTHEISNPVLWENKENIINVSSAELAQSVVTVITTRSHSVDCLACNGQEQI